MTSTTSVNEIIATGRIISIRPKEDGTASITLVTASGKEAFLRFLCPEGILSGIKERAHVEIHGYLKSYSYRDSETGNYKKAQRFIAKSINLEPTLTESKFGVEGKFFANPDCKIYLKGTVQFIRKDDNWYRIILRVKDGDVTNSQIQINMRELDRQPNIQENDTICCVCGVSTPKKELEGKTVYFENIQVSDLAIVDKN